MHSVNTCSLIPETKIFVAMASHHEHLPDSIAAENSASAPLYYVVLLSFSAQMTLQHCWQERNIFKRCNYEQKTSHSNLYTLYNLQFHHLVFVDIKSTVDAPNQIVLHVSWLSLSQFLIKAFYTVHVFQGTRAEWNESTRHKCI